MFARGQLLQAYDSLTVKILPYALEHGTAKTKLNVVLLLTKVALQLANTCLSAGPKA